MNGKRLTNTTVDVLEERMKGYFDRVTDKIMDLTVEVKDIKRELETEYVRKEDFSLVKNAVYGFMSLILVAVVGALVSLVLKK